MEKLKYYFEQTDNPIIDEDYREMETECKRMTSICDEVYNFVSCMQEVKLHRGSYTTRAIRQQMKDEKEKYRVTYMNKLSDVLTKEKDKIANEEEKRKQEAKLEEEKQHREISNSTPGKTAMARQTTIRTRDNRKETSDGENSETSSSETAQTDTNTMQTVRSHR